MSEPHPGWRQEREGRFLLAADDLAQIHAAASDPDYLRRLAADRAAEGMVEVDNPMRREVRPRRGIERRPAPGECSALIDHARECCYVHQHHASPHVDCPLAPGGAR